MSWITITTDDVKTRLAGAEINAYQTAALSQGQSDPLPEIISGVIKEARSRVAACPHNKLGDGETIPEEILHHVLNIIRYRLITRLPLRVSDDRRKEYEDGIKFLDQVAACKVAIVQPEDEADDQPTDSAVEVVTSKTRRVTGETMKGL